MAGRVYVATGDVEERWLIAADSALCAFARDKTRTEGRPKKPFFHGTVGSMSVIAFHEKAGRSQVGSLFFLDMVFSLAESAAILPSALLVSD